MSGLIHAATGWGNAALGLLYPEVCQVCGRHRAASEQSFLCAHCRNSVRFISRPFCERCGRPFPGQISASFECDQCRESEWQFSTARSAVAAQGVMLEVIHRYKYSRGLWFEPFLAELLIQKAAPELDRSQWDWLVPVPLHPAKAREREFNQADRLARRLSDATGIPLNTKLLRRSVPTPTQTFLSREERLANVRRAFALCGKPALDARRIVIIDDVFTTGATTGACARALREGGADQVCVWTVARGL